MKQIPNIFTLLNLVFGCIAIVMILQTGESIVLLDNGGATELNLPEKVWAGSLFIFGAAIVDFLDGFLARALKASSEMGKQLDSLSDVVSFGVAPGMILYQLLRLSYASEPNGLDVTVWALIPAFVFSAAAAYRLAKFNISTNQTTSFRGVPTPAAGLLVASFPLIIKFTKFGTVTPVLINYWFLYALILIVSYLMLSNRPFMALKFKDYSFQNNALKYIMVILAIICIVFLRWLAVPVIFLLYVIVSLFAKEPGGSGYQNKETIDLTV
jgi:CDP-diacylglycerol--serine O-phosphatidyltransferase